MIQALIGSIGSLASSYLEGKTAIQKAEATIRMKEARTPVLDKTQISAIPDRCEILSTGTNGVINTTINNVTVIAENQTRCRC